MTMNGNQATEQPIVQVRATVMMYDDADRQWVYSGSGSLSKVSIYQHMMNNTFRVVGRSLEDREVTINCVVGRNLRYNQATPTFHQWRDSRQIYGLQFESKEEADNFADAINAALETLTMTRDQLQQVSNPSQPVQKSTYAVHPDQYQTDSSRGQRYDQFNQTGREHMSYEDERQQETQSHYHHPFQSHHDGHASASSHSDSVASHQSPGQRSNYQSRPSSKTITVADSAPAPVSAGGGVGGGGSVPAPPPPPPPPPPAPSAAPPTAATPAPAALPPGKPTGADLASALKGVKLRDTSKTTEPEAAKETKVPSSSGPASYQSATLGRAAKAAPPAPPSKDNVMNEMARKLRERKERVEAGGGAAVALPPQPPAGGIAPLQDFGQFTLNSRSKLGNSLVSTTAEDTPITAASLPLGSGEANVAGLKVTTQEKKTVVAVVAAAANDPANATTSEELSSLVSDRPTSSTLSVELQALKAELLVSIRQELENTKQDIIDVIKMELMKQYSGPR